MPAGGQSGRGPEPLLRGLSPGRSGVLEKLKDELAGVQSSIEKLWELIGGLRKKGFRITEEEKVLLEQLVEQRGLYSEKRDALTAELKCFDQVLDKRSKGRVRCEKLFPTLEVQIGCEFSK